jgi:hypothetical protein
VKARFSSAAEAEVAAASENYESKQAGLGADFLSEVEAALHRIESFPFAWTPVSPRHANTEHTGFHSPSFTKLVQTKSLFYMCWICGLTQKAGSNC